MKLSDVRTWILKLQAISYNMFCFILCFLIISSAASLHLQITPHTFHDMKFKFSVLPFSVLYNSARSSLSLFRITELL